MTTMHAPSKLLNTAEAAERLGMNKSTLDQWRYLRRGPKFKKIGRLVKYSEDDLREYIEANTRTGTSALGLQAY